MSETTSQSQQLRSIQADLQSLYDEAKIAGNSSLMLNLSKSITTLSKQIKDQELHEREVIRRHRAIRNAQVVGTEFARLAKEQLGEAAIPILVELAQLIELIAEGDLVHD